MTTRRLVSVLARRRRQGSGGGAADIITALGGDAAVAAYYDVRAGVGVSGAGPTFVDSWEDARGNAGFGPTLSAAGVVRPSVAGGGADPVAGIYFNGHYLSHAAAIPAFDVSAGKSLLLVGSMTGGGSGNKYAAALASDAGAARLLGVAFFGGANISTAINGVTVSSGEPGSATRRVIVGGTAAGNVRARVPNLAAGTGAGAALGAGDMQLTLGLYHPDGAGFGECTLFAVFVLNRLASAADEAHVLAWATAVHGAVAA